MEQLFTIGLTNAVTATLLAVAAAAIARFTKRPALWYVLWLAVLLRLLAPPLMAVNVTIPEIGNVAADADTALVAVSGGAIAIDDSGFPLDFMTSVAVLWIAGALVVVGFAAAQSFQLRQILTASKPAREEVARGVETLTERLKLNRAPPTVEVDDRVPPMLWAFMGSVRLILPTDLLAKLESNQIDTLLAHELAHLSRRDHWVRHLEFAALAVFWWNPVAWWATRRLRRAQELCCDQRVAELLPGHRRAYADTLVETAKFLSGRQLPLGSPARAMADMSQMKGRIRMIMNDARTRELSLITRLAAAAILIATLAVTPILTATTDEPEFTGEPINLILEEVDLNDVLNTFSKIAHIEIMVEPGVSGEVTTKVEGVPWDKALADILEEQGLEWTLEAGRLIVRHGEGSWSALEEVENTSRIGGAKDDRIHNYVEGGTITEPIANEKVNPKYPPEMRKDGVSGQVIAELVIDEKGMVQAVEILESPAEGLSDASSEALEQWTFQPATMEGKPVAVTYMVTLAFKLK